MKILEARPLALPDVKVIRYARFADHRGYFTEHFRKSDFQGHEALAFLHEVEFSQCNESYSRPGVARGMHFQWSPHMGKLLRTLNGRMIDLFLDIRKASPTYGKIAAHDLPADPGAPHAEWIWVPPGFAHGNFFPVETTIEYFCSGEYSPGTEAGISPLAPDLDWSLCDARLRALFLEVVGSGEMLSPKDRSAPTLEGWGKDPRSENFVYGRC